VFTVILQQIFDIVYGARFYLPETKIVLGIALGLALLIYLKGPLGGLVASVLITFFIAKSFFAESNIYEISMERVFAGVVIGIIAFFTNIYFIVRTVADWRD
jgi:H+/Cl- antiporter ClcA